MRTLGDGSLVVTVSPHVLLGLGLILFVFAVILFIDSSPTPRQRLGGTCLLLLAAASVWSAESNRFVFDRSTRSVRWRRRTLFKLQQGEIPFDDIHEVTLESNWNDEPVRSRRLTLVTRSGRMPLSRGYTGLVRSHERVATAIRHVLGSRHSQT